MEWSRSVLRLVRECGNGAVHEANIPSKCGMARFSKIDRTEPSHFDSVAPTDGDWAGQQWRNEARPPPQMEVWARAEPERVWSGQTGRACRSAWRSCSGGGGRRGIGAPAAAERGGRAERDGRVERAQLRAEAELGAEGRSGRSVGSGQARRERSSRRRRSSGSGRARGETGRLGEGRVGGAQLRGVPAWEQPWLRAGGA